MKINEYVLIDMRILAESRVIHITFPEGEWTGAVVKEIVAKNFPQMAEDK